MLTLYLDVPVGRRTVLTMVFDEAWQLLRTEKTARAIFDWLADEGHHTVFMWSNDHLHAVALIPDVEYENPFENAGGDTD